MRYLEWILLLVISGLGIGLANFVGFQVGFMDSLPGQSDPTVQPAERCLLYTSDAADEL